MCRRFLRCDRRRLLSSRNQFAAVQQLEPRTLPTTSVLGVVQSGTNLTLTGDDQANAVTVEVTASGVTIKAREGTSLTFNNVAQNGAITIPVAAGVPLGDLKIELGGGSDSLHLLVNAGVGGRTIKSLSMNLGDEDDTVLLETTAGTSLAITGAVAILTGEGQDKVDLNVAGALKVAGTLVVDAGPDIDSAGIIIPGTLTVTGAASFLTGDGDDSLNFSGVGSATFETTLTINTAEDDDTLLVALNGGLTTKGAATITTGDGQDQITLTNHNSTLDFQVGLSVDAGIDANTVTITGNSGTLHSGGNLTITTGSGNDKVTLLEKLLVDGNFSVNTGDGQDDVLLSTGIGTASGSGTVANLIQGTTLIDTGTGADKLTVSVVKQSTLAVAGTATIKTGSGNDQAILTNAGTTLTFAKGLTIDTGTGTTSGVDGVTVSGGTLNVTGAFKVSTGAQNDSVVFSAAMTVSGDLNIDTGTGADVVTVGLTSTANNLLGSLTINTGTGADEVGISTTLGATTRIVGLTTINTGNGSDSVSITASGALTFVKDVTISTGLNDDRVRIEAKSGLIRMNGHETVDLGGQNDCFLQGTTASLNAILNPAAPPIAAVVFQVSGNLSISGGNGIDTIGLAGVQVGKDRPTPTAAFPASTTTIDAGAGDDVIETAQDIVRDLKIMGGDGNDTVGCHSLTIRGTTNIDLGAGGDRIVIGGNSSLSDNVTVLGGTGNDKLAIGIAVTLATDKKIAVNGGTGVNVTMNDSAITSAAFNPAPINWPFGIVDSSIIESAINAALQSCFPS